MRHLNFKFLLLLIFLVLSARGHADETLPPDMARIKQRGELIVAMYYQDEPPFYMHNSKNELVGIDVDIARDLAEKLGVKLNLQRDAKTYDDVVLAVANRKADIAISTISDTLERAVSVRFTVPYWSLKQVLMVNRLKLSVYKDHPNFKKVETLLNQTGIVIGVIKGTSYVDFAKKLFPLATIETYDTLADGVADTKKNKLLAFLYDEVGVVNWNKAHPEDSLFLRSDVITQSQDTLAIAVHWQDNHLLSWLNLSIEQSKNNFLQKLTTKYANVNTQ